MDDIHTGEQNLHEMILKAPPEEKHQRAEKSLKVVVLIDVTLIIQLDVSKHLQKTGRFGKIKPGLRIPLMSMHV